MLRYLQKRKLQKRLTGLRDEIALYEPLYHLLASYAQWFTPAGNGVATKALEREAKDKFEEDQVAEIFVELRKLSIEMNRMLINYAGPVNISFFRENHILADRILSKNDKNAVVLLMYCCLEMFTGAQRYLKLMEEEKALYKLN